MPLTDIQCKKEQPGDKPRKVADGNGLYLEIMPNGSKYWRMKYRFAGKEKKLAFGVYPEVSLKEARGRRDDARRQLRDNLDPMAEKRAIKLQIKVNHDNSFENVALEWLDKQDGRWSKKHLAATRRRMERNLFPALGKRPIAEITAPEVLAVLRKMEERDAIDLAHRGQQTIGQILRYAIATGRAEHDVTQYLKGALKTQKKENHSYLKEDELPGFLKALESYPGDYQTKNAVKLLLYTFVRTGELRGAKWSEFNFDKAEWRIPAERMKMREVHIVPLSDQVIDLLKNQKPLSGDSDYAFPGRSNLQKIMSENTVLGCIRRLGYQERTTGHGFRATASTILHENGFNSDYIERQLAHAPRNKVRASYDHAKFLSQRKELMQWWANFLDGKKNGK